MSQGDRTSGGTHMTLTRLAAIMAVGAAMTFGVVWLVTRTIAWWIEVLI